jgi:hypothetical protein
MAELTDAFDRLTDVGVDEGESLRNNAPSREPVGVNVDITGGCRTMSGAMGCDDTAFAGVPVTEIDAMEVV